MPPGEALPIRLLKSRIPPENQNPVSPEYNLLQTVAPLPSRTEEKWYVLRVTYSRELQLKEYLDTKGISNFLPMQQMLVLDRNGKRVKRLLPVVHNLLFTHTSRQIIDDFKQELEGRIPVRFYMDRETSLPLTVPEQEMRNFIAVAGTQDEQLLYLPPSEVAMKKGDRVRIIGGIFEGVEGEILRLRGDRRLVVRIPGLMAVATAFIHPSLVQRIATPIE